MSVRLRRSLLPLLALSLVATSCGKQPNAPAPRTMTGEERTLQADGLLPANYGALIAAGDPTTLGRHGLAGPFSSDFGDPDAQLAAARYARTHGEFHRFVRTVQPGDLVFVAPNNPKNFVARMTGGPFSHVMICTAAGAPGEFIEAVGVTGERGDQVLDRVRRTTAAGLANDQATLRILRPTGASAEARAKAIAFATAQLGKPYNYAFSDVLGGDRAFYCSSLAYRAYQAAGIPVTPKKDAARDRLVEAFTRPVMALQPDDPVDLATRVMYKLHQTPPPGPEEFAKLIVEDVLPRCKRTARLVTNDREKANLTRALGRLIAGKPFPHFSEDAAAYKEASTKIKIPVVHCLRNAALEAKMVADFARDTAALLGIADINGFRALQALGVVLHAMGPYVDVFAAYLTGPNSAETRAAARLLDVLDALKPLGPFWPSSDLGPQNLPGRAPWTVANDFVSPTDLAWTDVPHDDFNTVEPKALLTPWLYAVVPADGRFIKLLE
ncbi:MAG: hypothetical protein JWM80_2862 [Cyanobacteria bacterium RYN_339]|nr:hypothetical protein [Cyanobacteria bacterium RYN_339]